MPYTYFRKKIFRKYVLIFTFFYMIRRRFCSFVSQLVFRAFPSGRAIRCKSSLPSGLFPAIPNALRSGYAGERYDDFS